MNTELALWKVLISLPESLKTELLHYAEYLREKYPHNQQSQEKIETVRGYGSWANEIIMSDDFDELRDCATLSQSNLQEQRSPNLVVTHHPKLALQQPLY